MWILLWVLALVVGSVRPVMAQSSVWVSGPDLMARPSEAVPEALWRDVRQCAAEVGLPLTPEPAPRVVRFTADAVIPRDPKTDSLLVRMGLGPLERRAHVGYAFVVWNRVALAQSADSVILRHELLHFVVWRGLHRAGHPDPVFSRCT